MNVDVYIKPNNTSSNYHLNNINKIIYNGFMENAKLSQELKCHMIPKVICVFVFYKPWEKN